MSTGKGNASSGIGRRRDLARKGATESYQERRAEIARAAAKVFDKRGYRGTTIGAVAEAMGTDRASLYYYISGKEELFDEVVREVTEVNVTTAEEIRATNAPAPEKLRAMIEALMASYAQNYPMLYVYMRENLKQLGGTRSGWSRHMRRLNKRYEEAVIDVVQQGMDEGTIRPVGSARVIGFGIIGMVGWTNRWFDPERSPEPAEQIARTYADMVLAGLVVDQA
jgi:TetR/AcrR family transcriptional regulator, cholesterol catabolism regulator